MTDFTPGQRWLSESETELGLGLIKEVDYRLVTVLYPAVEEERTYAKNNAPLSRITFDEGDTLTTGDGLELVVQSAEDHNGLMVYPPTPPASRTMCSRCRNPCWAISCASAAPWTVCSPINCRRTAGSSCGCRRCAPARFAEPSVCRISRVICPSPNRWSTMVEASSRSAAESDGGGGCKGGASGFWIE